MLRSPLLCEEIKPSVVEEILAAEKEPLVTIDVGECKPSEAKPNAKKLPTVVVVTVVPEEKVQGGTKDAYLAFVVPEGDEGRRVMLDVQSARLIDLEAMKKECDYDALRMIAGGE